MYKRQALHAALRAAATSQETQQQIYCLLLMAQLLQASGQQSEASHFGQALLALPDIGADAKERLSVLGYRVPAAHAIALSVLCAQALEQLRED